MQQLVDQAARGLAARFAWPDPPASRRTQVSSIRPRVAAGTASGSLWCAAGLRLIVPVEQCDEALGVMVGLAPARRGLAFRSSCPPDKRQLTAPPNDPVAPQAAAPARTTNPTQRDDTS